MLNVIESKIGTLLDNPATNAHDMLTDLSNPRNDNKKSIYLNILKNAMDLLQITNKGYSMVFMKQLQTDIARNQNYQTLPPTKTENLLIVCFYS